MRDGWLLEAAAARRQAEQFESPADDGVRDPWAISGPNLCGKCGAELDRGTGELNCERCRILARPPRCPVPNCRRPAGSLGLCRFHRRRQRCGVPLQRPPVFRTAGSRTKGKAG
jgi:hypothetical protein